MHTENKFSLPVALRVTEVVIAVIVFALPLVTNITILESLFITLGCFFIVEVINLSTKLSEVITRLNQLDASLLQRDNLLHLIQRCDLEPGQLEEIFQIMIDIFNKRHPVLQNIAKWTLLDYKRSIREISNGRFEHGRRHPKAFGRAAIKDVLYTLDAVTTLDAKVVGDFWREKLAAGHYFNANVEAIRRGVKIQRVFIYRDALSADDHDVLTKQYKAGIQVYTLGCQADEHEIRRVLYHRRRQYVWCFCLNHHF